MSGGGGGTSPKHDLDDTKFDSKSEGRQYSDTPPLYDPAETHTATASLSRSFTIPTPESSPSSCTSDVFHAGAGAGGYQTVSASAPPLSSIEGESLIFKDRYFIPKQNLKLYLFQDYGIRPTRCPHRKYLLWSPHHVYRYQTTCILRL